MKHKNHHMPRYIRGLHVSGFGGPCSYSSRATFSVNGYQFLAPSYTTFRKAALAHRMRDHELAGPMLQAYIDTVLKEGVS
jgi:hypothetical protein